LATAIQTKTPSLTAEERFVLRNVGWKGYEAILKVVGDRLPRITYDRGDLELMSPSYDHDLFRILLGPFIATLTEELGMPCRSLGSMTWRKKSEDRGLEADDCFYLINQPRLYRRGERTFVDLKTGPPPDLAIEVEITHSALDRMGIYAALRIPEVWRFNGRSLKVQRLRADRTYATVSRSPLFPTLPLQEVVRWLQRGLAAPDQNAWVRDVREWIRAEVAPRPESR
jgi:Uma2 family endonuclease